MTPTAYWHLAIFVGTPTILLPRGAPMRPLRMAVVRRPTLRGERLAGLPNQQQPSNAQPDGQRHPRLRMASRANSRPTARAISAQITPAPNGTDSGYRGTEYDPARPFDGTYTGLRQLTGFSSPTCRPTRLYHDHDPRRQAFISGKNVTTTVAPDGSFSDYGAVEGILPPITQHLTGRIQSGAIEADLTNQNCNYHMSLKKSG